MSAEITCINKIASNGKTDTFEYRDMYNDVQTVDFPTTWDMSEDDVEEYLTTTPEDYKEISKKLNK